MGRTTLKHLIAQELASTKQAELYRSMADAVRKLDPTYTSDTVNEEAGRFVRLARELDESAEELASEIAGRFTYEQAAAAYDAAGAPIRGSR